MKPADIKSKTYIDFLYWNKKVVKRKDDKLYVKRKGYDNSFKSWIDKKILLYKMSHFPELDTNKSNIEVELNLSHYATKS